MLATYVSLAKVKHQAGDEPRTNYHSNGAPRSGKSSIVAVIQEKFDGPWMNLGVDVQARHITPPRYRPGIGLRPGGERQDIEPLIPLFYVALHDSIAAHTRLGLNVVVDVGYHDAYAMPRNILTESANRLDGLPVLFVGVRCPIEVIMERRNTREPGRESHYVAGPASGPVPDLVLRWQSEVHIPGIYDLEVDTSVSSPEECAGAIRRYLELPACGPTAFQRIAARVGM